MPNLALHNKRLAIFLDGTWNESDDNTSVWRLRSLCAARDETGVAQQIYYDRGVGTEFGEKLAGGLFGAGIDLNVRKAYEWLVENYEDGDDIFIFGFSRGAFTARSLAGMISICGLLEPGSPLGVGQLYERYQRVNRNHESIRQLLAAKQGGKILTDREETWVVTFSRPIAITMIGVWDTVAALDLPGIGAHEFLDPYLRHDMLNAFQALAIDENRHRFAPTLWTQSSPEQDGPPKISRDFAQVEQRWFVGAHANVGGGYASDPLPQLPLRWLAQRAASLGLAFRKAIDVDGRVDSCAIDDSYATFLNGTYKIVSRRFHRPIGQSPSVSEGYWIATINETIDESVFRRWRSDVNYRPQSLVDWAKSNNVDDLGQIQTTVRADDPSAALKR
jgi:uncharacterized protein (DUF2235 family)